MQELRSDHGESPVIRWREPGQMMVGTRPHDGWNAIMRWSDRILRMTSGGQKPGISSVIPQIHQGDASQKTRPAASLERVDSPGAGQLKWALNDLTHYETGLD